MKALSAELREVPNVAHDANAVTRARKDEEQLRCGKAFRIPIRAKPVSVDLAKDAEEAKAIENRMKEDDWNMEDMSVMPLVSASSTAVHALESPPLQESIKASSCDLVNAPTVVHNTNAVARTRRVEE